MKRYTVFSYRLIVLTAATALFGVATPAQAADAKKPNILILWGDDIGWNNPSCYHRGMMGYQTPEAPRKEFFYWTDGGDLSGLRYGRWKIVFQEQRAHGLDVWQDPLVTLRFPKLFCLRTDPYERADHEAGDYDHWRVDHAFVLVPAQGYVARHLDTFKEFPPRQKPGSFSLDQVLEALQSAPKN